MQRVEQATNGIETSWFQALGFHFDPFLHLEASTDPHLIDYMVGHDVFAAAWDAAPSLIYAPPGGGKTAMRLYTERACWSSFGPRHPFPILHQPALGDMEGAGLALEQHCLRLEQAAARSVLLGLCVQPERLLDCTVGDRRRVGAILAALPRPAAFYARILRSKGDVRSLAPYLGRAAWFGTGGYLSTDKLETFCATLAALDQERAELSGDGCERLAYVKDTLVDVLGYRAVFLLIDGVDGLSESAQTPAAGGAWLDALLTVAETWSEHKLFVKGFLPSDYADLLVGVHGSQLRLFAQTTIRWTPELLAELLRRRVAVASGGAFGSLDAISSPALRDVETLISRRVPPLPREAIVFVRALLQRAVQDADGATVTLEPEHLDATTAWYQVESSRLGIDLIAPVTVSPAQE